PKGQPPIPPDLPQADAGAFSSGYGYGQSCLTGKNGAIIPYVRFTKDRQLIIDSANICTTFEGTNTTDALTVGHALLTENQRHLKGRPQAMFLLTDGIPTVGGYIKAAKEFGKDGIPIKV